MATTGFSRAETSIDGLEILFGDRSARRYLDGFRRVARFGEVADFRPHRVGSLPAVARSACAADKTRRPDALIRQAEIGPDGRTTSGVIRRHEIRAATVDELTDILSFEDLARQEQEAAEKIKGGKD